MGPPWPSRLARQPRATVILLLMERYILMSAMIATYPGIYYFSVPADKAATAAPATEPRAASFLTVSH